MAVKEKHPDHLEKAEAMLMVPDYFQFLLTGKRASEYTNATTTQLVSPKTKDWDFELIEMLGYPKHIFQPIKKPVPCWGRSRKRSGGKWALTARSFCLPPMTQAPRGPGCAFQ